MPLPTVAIVSFFSRNGNISPLSDLRLTFASFWHLVVSAVPLFVVASLSCCFIVFANFIVQPSMLLYRFAVLSLCCVVLLRVVYLFLPFLLCLLLFFYFAALLNFVFFLLPQRAFYRTVLMLVFHWCVSFLCTREIKDTQCGEAK